MIVAAAYIRLFITVMLLLLLLLQSRQNFTSGIGETLSFS